jgi:hypothetical protein
VREASFTGKRGPHLPPPPHERPCIREHRRHCHTYLCAPKARACLHRPHTPLPRLRTMRMVLLPACKNIVRPRVYFGHGGRAAPFPRARRHSRCRGPQPLDPTMHAAWMTLVDVMQQVREEAPHCGLMGLIGAGGMRGSRSKNGTSTSSCQSGRRSGTWNGGITEGSDDSAVGRRTRATRRR